MQHDPPRVLSIDDDRNVRDNIVAYLEDSGFDVVEAENGKMGLEVYEKTNPDIVLVDLRMPVMDGMQFLSAIRKVNKRLPVIVVSGVGVLEEAVEALRHGAWDYVTKPISDMVVLEHAVNKALERAKLLEERERYQERLELEVAERTKELRDSNERLIEFQNLLQEKNQFLEALIESMPNPVFFKSLEGRYLGCNAAFCHVLNLGKDEIVGRRAEDLLPEEIACSALESSETLLPDGRPQSCTLILNDSTGAPMQLVLFKSFFKDRVGANAGVVGIFHDITELKSKEAQILYQAYHDELTGLANRARLKEAISERMQSKGGNFVVLMLDLDNFKNVNDSLGHAMGDKLLLEAARRLKDVVGSVALLARTGGDEFALLVEGSKEHAVELADKTLEAFTRPFVIDDHELFISVSLGLTCWPEDGADADALVKNADIAMYKAKEQGRSRYLHFDAEMTEQVTRRLAIEKSIRKGLERDEFHVFYQPKINIISGRLVGMEALVRWMPESGQVVSPAEFIPVAEETGLIVALGEHVLRKACEQMRIWNERGWEHLRVSVNISARQFQANLTERVAAALRDSGIPPDALELEVTETTMMQDMGQTVMLLEQLNAMGLKIAIDDFGTGHSSLYYLKRFPINTLKIDRSFVRDIMTDDGDASIVSTIITMGRNLSLEVVAEGVETDEQLQFLRENGCAEVQGYYFSKPLPADEFEAFVVHHESQVDAVKA
ncbi:EAL domain-containing protein [Oleidesulfovibrio sp.]|uniref:EAL domain-containing response regulator n=1 Tax=Oleidesulfovibrio sp. TaxID=2909707 RepID=UPI003A8BD67F